jgi:hypothetical protein
VNFIYKHGHVPRQILFKIFRGGKENASSFARVEILRGSVSAMFLPNFSKWRNKEGHAPLVFPTKTDFQKPVRKVSHFVGQSHTYFSPKTQSETGQSFALEFP